MKIYLKTCSPCCLIVFELAQGLIGLNRARYRVTYNSPKKKLRFYNVSGMFLKVLGEVWGVFLDDFEGGFWDMVGKLFGGILRGV